MNKKIDKTIKAIDRQLESLLNMKETFDKNDKDQFDKYIKSEKTYLTDSIMKDIILCLSEQRDHCVCIDYEQIERILLDEENANLSLEEAGNVFSIILRHNAKLLSYENSDAISCLGAYELGIPYLKLKKYYEKFHSGKANEEITHIMQYITDSEQNYRKNNLLFYQMINDFLNEKEHTDEMYRMFNLTLLSLNIPKKLISAIILYYQKRDAIEAANHIRQNKIVEKPKEKTESVVIEGPSKRQLKNQLNEYDSIETFDFKKMEEFLNILKQLQTPDEKYGYYLGPLYRKALRNEEYYKFIINKILFMNNNPALVRNLKEQLDLLDFYTKENEKVPCNEEINEIKNHICYLCDMSDAEFTFDYEIYLNSEKCKQKRA